MSDTKDLKTQIQDTLKRMNDYITSTDYEYENSSKKTKEIITPILVSTGLYLFFYLFLVNLLKYFLITDRSYKYFHATGYCIITNLIVLSIVCFVIIGLNEPSYFFSVALFYIFGIVVFTIILLYSNNLLVRIFENTIGYFILKNFWYEKLNLLMKEFYDKKIKQPSQEGTLQSVDFTFLITLISILDMNILEGGVFDDKQKQEIKNYAALKYSIGFNVWVLFASILCAIISTKYFIERSS